MSHQRKGWLQDDREQQNRLCVHTVLWTEKVIYNPNVQYITFHSKSNIRTVMSSFGSLIDQLLEIVQRSTNERNQSYQYVHFLSAVAIQYNVNHILDKAWVNVWWSIDAFPWIIAHRWTEWIQFYSYKLGSTVENADFVTLCIANRVNKSNQNICVLRHVFKRNA